MHRAEGGRDEDDPDHVDFQKIAGGEGRKHNEHGNPVPVPDQPGGHIPDHRHDYRRHAGLHAPEQGLDRRMIPEGAVEHGDQRQDDEGGNHRAQHRAENAGKAPQPVAHHDGAVDGNRAGGGLGNGHQVQHLLLINPVQLLHEFIPEQRYDDIPSAEGEGAQIQGRKKDFQISAFCFQGFSPPTDAGFPGRGQYTPSAGRKQSDPVLLPSVQQDMNLKEEQPGLFRTERAGLFLLASL